MQMIRLRSRVEANGNLQLQLGGLLANQELEIILVYQPVESSESAEISSGETDPLIGLFAGSPDLAINAEEILQQDINHDSGWTWKSS